MNLFDEPTLCDTTLTGELATAAWKSLAEPRREIEVVCREPSETITKVYFGTSPTAGAYVYRECPAGNGKLTTSDSCDAAQLFQQWLEYLTMRQCMVNSSPMSNDFFSMNPDLDAVVEQIQNELQINVTDLH